MHKMFGYTNTSPVSSSVMTRASLAIVSHHCSTIMQDLQLISVRYTHWPVDVRYYVCFFTTHKTASDGLTILSLPLLYRRPYFTPIHAFVLRFQRLQLSLTCQHQAQT